MLSASVLAWTPLECVLDDNGRAPASSQHLDEMLQKQEGCFAGLDPEKQATLDAPMFLLADGMRLVAPPKWRWRF